MANNSNVLTSLAGKLGLSDVKIIRKASEYERLLTLRLSQANNISCTAKAFICLDLAASSCGAAFDAMHAIKLSGLKKPMYLKSRQMAEKLLNLNKSLTIKNFCVMNNCIEAADTAEMILKKYKELDIKDTDVTHPQYVTMAIYHSCKLHKINVPKVKFLTASNLKPSLWARLEEEWTNFVSKYFKDVKPSNNKRSKTNCSNQNSLVEEIEKGNQKKNEDDIDNKEGEDYKSWKARILEQAYKELNGRQTHAMPISLPPLHLNISRRQLY